MQHGPAAKLEVDNASEKKAKLGIYLFICYSIIYVGFVAIGAFNYELFGEIVFAGQNLAVIYGFGLIILAIVMGLVYNHICTRYEDEMNKKPKSKAKAKPKKKAKKGAKS